MSKNVLVTGLSGLIGSALRPALEDEFNLSALNRSDVAGIPTTQASLENYDDNLPAFHGQDMVIHLAAKISDSAGWQDLLETNVIGTRHVFEAAKESGVKRVVFASSGATVSGWEQVEPYKSIDEGRYEVGSEYSMIGESMATRPGNVDASTKIWGESLARHYAGTFGLEVVCLRIGFANAQDRPTNARQFSVWNSQRDVVQAIRLAMEVELPEKFEVFFVLSNNRWAYRSLDHAKTGLGYEPADSAESYR